MYVILDRPPVGQCDLCGTPFFGERDTIAHLQTAQHRIAAVAEIAARHRQRERLALFYESEDPEIEAHMRTVGRRMRREGRWTVKPSERAGF
jgi:hypothetical protein